MILNNPYNINFPEFMNEEFFENALEEGLRESKVNIKEIKISWGCKPGENYCSQIYRVLVKYIITNQKIGDLNSISIIIKTIPITEDTQFLEDVEVYVKEIIIYRDILPRMEILLDGDKFGARYLYSLKSPVKTIIFNDLTIEGFTMAPRQQGLDFQHSSLILQQLGRFHAASMVLAKRDPKIMLRFRKGYLCEETIFRSETFYQMFEGDLRQLIKISKKWTGYQDITEKLQRYYNKFKEISSKLGNPKEGDSIFVLNHGDMWINNFMFKYGDDRGTKKPSKAVFLDFQYSFYGSPGCDINFFLNTSVALDVLKQQRNELISIYYRSFSESLEYLHYSPVPSIEDLYYELRSRELYGFFGLFGFLSMVTMPKDLVGDTSIEAFSNEEYKQKMLDKIYEREELQEHFRYSLKRLNDLKVLDEF